MPDPSALSGPSVPPRLTPLGLDGLLVTFADSLDEAANRAALAFRAAVNAEGWDGVTETATSLASAYLTFDPGRTAYDGLRDRAADLLDSRDWRDAPLPAGRRRFTIPACFDGDHAPRLDDVAAAVGISRDAAIAQLCADPLRALALGYAPGQAYLGDLPPAWDIARRTDLTRVPTGAVVVAVRQAIVFATSGPTGWSQVAMTRFHGFRPDDPDRPIAIAPGDEVRLRAVSAADLDALSPPDGGVEIVEIAE